VRPEEIKVKNLKHFGESEFDLRERVGPLFRRFLRANRITAERTIRQGAVLPHFNFFDRQHHDLALDIARHFLDEHGFQEIYDASIQPTILSRGATRHNTADVPVISSLHSVKILFHKVPEKRVNVDRL